MTNIDKCGLCGAILTGITPEHWFQCSVCGFMYRWVNGVWMDQDEYDDLLACRGG